MNDGEDLTDDSSKWQWGETFIDKELLQYILVYFFLFTVGIAALVNLSLQSSHSELWASLLSMCCGLACPSPRYRKNGEDNEPWTRPQSPRPA